MKLIKRKVVFIDMIWYLKILSANELIVFVDLVFLRKQSWIENNSFIIFLLCERSWDISINSF